MYTAHNTLPFYNRDRFIACFRDRHLLIITRHIIVEHIKENHKSVYKAFITTSKRLQLFDFNSWKPVSRFGLFFMKSRIFPYRDYKRQVAIAIQYISLRCISICIKFSHLAIYTFGHSNNETVLTETKRKWVNHAWYLLLFGFERWNLNPERKHTVIVFLINNFR